MSLTGRVGGLSIALTCLLSQRALASGYQPGFDQALEGAEIVVVGTIVDAWSPERRGSVESRESGSRIEVAASVDMPFRAYRLKIERAFKGQARRGREIVFWDPSWGNTASHGVPEKGRVVVFLVRRPPTDLEAHAYEFRVPVTYAPISCTGEEEAAAYYRYNLRLLDIKVAHPPRDLADAWRSVLEAGDNPFLMRYAVEHWSSDLSPNDRALLASLVERHKVDQPWLVGGILDLLSSKGVDIGDAGLVALMKTASPDLRPQLAWRVNATNIALCRDVLWAWLVEDGPAADDMVVKALTSFARDFVMAKLREQELPFWKLIPLFRALKINGADVGRESFPPETLALSPTTLFGAARLVRGDGFLAGLAIAAPDRHREWRAALPLFLPLLQREDGQIRRTAVALMRTLGAAVTRSGKGYDAVLGAAPLPPPVALRLRTAAPSVRAGEDFEIDIEETATSGRVWLSHAGTVHWTAQFGSTFITWDEGRRAPFEDEGDVPRSAFVLLAAGDRRSTVHRVRIGSPGHYRISASKVYYRDGARVGLDAWTGAVVPEAVEIDVTERARQGAR